MVTIKTLKDHFHNTAYIQAGDILPYYGSPVREKGFRVWIEDSEGLVYHVQVFPSLGDALNALRDISLGQWEEV